MVSLEPGTISAKQPVKMKTAAFFLLLGFNITAGTSWKQKNIGKSVFSNEVMDVTDFSVYYDVESNKTITKMMPRPWYKPGWLLRLPFTGGPCKCEGLKCTCCTGIRIQSINFDRQTCAILKFEPTESMIEMDVQMNNASVYRNVFSARNPPPLCAPIPVPYLPPGLVDMCVRLFDITLMGQGLHVCMDIDTRIDKAPVLILHFDCMDMGLNGIGLSKPGGSANLTNIIAPGGVTTPAPAEPTQVDSDVYDTVTESSSVTEPAFVNSVKYI